MILGFRKMKYYKNIKIVIPYFITLLECGLNLPIKNKI